MTATTSQHIRPPSQDAHEPRSSWITLIRNPSLLALAIAWVYPTMRPFAHAIGTRLLPGLVSFTLMDYTVAFAVLLLTGRTFLKSVRPVDFVLVTGLIASFTISLVAFPENTLLIAALLPALTGTVLIYYPVGRVLRDFDGALRVLVLASILVVATGAAYAAYAAVAHPSATSSYNMVRAYLTLPSALILLGAAIERPTVMRWLLALASTFFVLGQGTRGPIVCMGVFVIVQTLYRVRSISSKLATLGLATGGVFATFGVMSTDVLVDLAGWLEERRLSSRIIRLLVEGDIASDSGRGRIVDLTMDNIDASPIFGHGVLGDRRFLNGTYPHNVVLELWAQFGLVTGTVVVIAFVVSALRAFSTAPVAARNLLLVLVSASVVKLFMSGSYLNESLLFMLIGLLVNLNAPHRATVASRGPGPAGTERQGPVGTLDSTPARGGPR